jgi:hypothetical protein
VGDWATFNGTAWQRVEGGAAGNFTDLTASGTVTLSGGTATGLLFLNASKQVTTDSFLTYSSAENKVTIGRPLFVTGTSAFSDNVTIGSTTGTSTTNPLFQFQGRNDWPLPQILRFQADYVSGAASGMGLTISSRVSDGTFQNRYRLLADGTAHIWSLGATGSEQMRLTSTGLGIGTSSPTEKLQVAGAIRATGAVSANATGGILAYQGSGTTMLGAWGANTSTVGQIQFYLSSSDGSVNGELMRLTSTGLGIGTSSPNRKLEVNGIARFTDGTTNAEIACGGGVAYFGPQTNSPLAFQTNNIERMRLDSSGNLGLGVTPSASTSNYRTLQIGGAASYGIYGQRLLGSAENFMGWNAYGGNNTTTYATGFYYRNSGDGATMYSQTNFHSWHVAPSGTAGDAISFTQALTLDASSNLLLGTTSTTYGSIPGKFTSCSATAGSAGLFYTGFSGDVSTSALNIGKFDNDNSTSQIFVKFGINNAGTGSGQINANGGGAVAFGSFSDRRLKENIEPLASQLSNICALNPVEFDYKTGGHQIGFIAQEMQEIYPDTVGEDNDGMLSITGWSKTEARLVKAIQELKAEFDAYKATHP